MAIIIPSKNIFQSENSKVIKNEIGGTSFNQKTILTKQKEIFNLSFSPYVEESAMRFFTNYVQYTDVWDTFNYENIWNFEDIVINNITCHGIRIKITSENYIHIPSIRAKLSIKYRRGQGYEGVKRPSIHANGNMDEEKTRIVEGIRATGVSFQVLPGNNYIPAAYCRMRAVSIDANIDISKDTRQKSLFIDFFIPKFYQGTGETQNTEIFTSFQLSILANEIIVDSEETVIGENPVERIESNELFQKFDGEEQIDSEPRGVYLFEYGKGYFPATNELSQKIIREYRNGKEVIKIRCSISDYFNEQGEKAIDINSNEMSFNIGDFVIPMVFGADGKDRPVSTYIGGTPKVFSVVGLKFIYDGAVWQELTLQEVTNG